MSRTAHVTPNILQKVAKAMLPLYIVLSKNDKFASLWCRAVRKADLDRLEQLLYKVSPRAARESISVNGIGYFVSFQFPRPVNLYMNGTAIPPGKVQFYFRKRVVRAIASAVMPLYLELSRNKCFADAFANGLQRNDQGAIHRMVRGLIKTPALRSVKISNAGVILCFKYSNSKYPYHNLLLCEYCEKKRAKKLRKSFKRC